MRYGVLRPCPLFEPKQEGVREKCSKLGCLNILYTLPNSVLNSWRTRQT